jgi:hypothetical protein
MPGNEQADLKASKKLAHHACASSALNQFAVSTNHRWIGIAAFGGWILLVGSGLGVLVSFENSPGVAESPAIWWPSDSRIVRAENRATLVMLAHPHCPCTGASLRELELLMARLSGRLLAHVLFVEPAGAPADWEKSDLWDQAAAIRDVHVAWDIGGVEASRFRASTSGHVVVYSAQGKLLFNGGITPSRGHSGDNAGRSAIVAALTGVPAGPARGFVFGCSLVDDRQKPVETIR